ncbi:MAG: DUF2029 domain-containing protein [Candidatus Thermoplasmatota archaeon]|nr:DUF2029 domain-containing protein [Candidatus Thermoplasmatota archaeon]
MERSWEKLRSLFESLTSRLESLSFKKLILILIIVWLLLYLPATFFLSIGQSEEYYAYYPEAANPMDFDNKDYNVTTLPQSMEEAAGERFVKPIQNRTTVEFNWTAWDYDSSRHIGRINVYYELNGTEGVIRLKNVHRAGDVTSWAAEKTFKDEGTLKYYYRVDKDDISIFHRRTSVLLEGKNIYEEVRTGPPPLIHLFFIPPTLMTLSPEAGGAYLSFILYFSIFILFDSLLLFSGFKEFGKSKAFLMSLLFMVNPVTIFNIHQDEAIVAFTMLLPLLFLIKKRDKISSILAGISIPVKIWGGFIFPIYLLRKELGLKKRLKHVFSGVLVTSSIFLFFYLLWGSNSIWFLSQYSGTTEVMGLGPLSFWGRWLDVFSMSSQDLPRTSILVCIGALELLILYLAYKKDRPPLMTLTSLLCVFFGLYVKIHWDYYIILFPFLLYFTVRDKRLFFAFVSIVSTIYLMMFFASTSFFVPSILMALLNTLVLFLLLYHVFLFMRDKKIYRMELDEIWGRKEVEA